MGRNPEPPRNGGRINAKSLRTNRCRSADMKQPYYVHAQWDEEAKVWVAASDDVPGLATEAATCEELVQQLKSLIPELLAENGQLPPHPTTFELLTPRFELAACRTRKRDVKEN